MRRSQCQGLRNRRSHLKACNVPEGISGEGRRGLHDVVKLNGQCVAAIGIASALGAGKDGNTSHGIHLPSSSLSFAFSRAQGRAAWTSTTEL